MSKGTTPSLLSSSVSRSRVYAFIIAILCMLACSLGSALHTDSIMRRCGDAIGQEHGHICVAQLFLDLKGRLAVVKNDLEKVEACVPLQKMLARWNSNDPATHSPVSDKMNEFAQKFGYRSWRLEDMAGTVIHSGVDEFGMVDMQRVLKKESRKVGYMKSVDSVCVMGISRLSYANDFLLLLVKDIEPFQGVVKAVAWESLENDIRYHALNNASLVMSDNEEYVIGGMALYDIYGDPIAYMEITVKNIAHEHIAKAQKKLQVVGVLLFAILVCLIFVAIQAINRLFPKRGGTLVLTASEQPEDDSDSES